MEEDIKRPRGRPRKDGFPTGSPPPALPPSARDAAQQAIADFRIKNSLFRDRATEQPKQSMSRIYRECRRIARVSGPEMLWSLVSLALECDDPRVRMLSAIAVLDRGGIMPSEFNPDEETKDLHLLPLAERRERLRLLLARAAELVQETRLPVEGDC
jgi:hypothetical protein